jgi:hypothetical protein
VFIYIYIYIVVFWVMTSCRLGGGFQHSGKAYGLHCQNRILRLEAADSYKTPVNTYHTTQRRNSEDHNPNIHVEVTHWPSGYAEVM